MSKQFKTRATQGFTLVELSIVIVIIGFLVAGIAAGANMVKQAEIRSVISDLQSYQTAYNNFIAKYNKAPGDMDTALSFWPTTCSDTDDAAACNGNGNGKIEVGADDADEVRAALKHLALANMISAGIPVIPLLDTDLVAGTNAPTSKISGAGYFLVSGSPDQGGTLVSKFGDSTNVVFLGKAATGDNLVNSSVKPEDAFSIDQKLDDAIVTGAVESSPLDIFFPSANAAPLVTPTTFTGAITGNIRVINGADITVGTDDCVDDTDGASYIVSTTTNACLLGLALN
jgi:prepilin-type N-terminal cleavage/methylation domain-containing protein